MLYSIRKHSSYILTLGLWSVVGMLSTTAAMLVILVTLFLFFQKGRYFEALFGFFFLLVLSDNLETLFAFAKVVKPFYLLMMFILVIMRRKELLKNFDFIIRFAPFMVVAMVCIYYSVTVGVSIQKIVSYSLILIVVPNIIIAEYKRIGPQLFVNLVAFSFIIHMISIAILIFFPEVGISHGDRWRGVFGNPNGLGLFLIVYHILFRVVSSKFPEYFTRKDRYFYLIISFLFVWMSGSRNALLSILIFEAISFGFQYSKPITILVIVSLFFYFDYVADFFINFLASIGLGSTLRLESIEEGSGRVIAWVFAWDEIVKNTMILGRGLGYDEYFMRQNFNYLSRLGHEGGVHNTYLILWLNTGLVGLIAFFTAFFSFFSQAFKKNNFALPTMVAILSSINYEPWLSGSLNPYTVVYVVLMTFYLYIDDIDLNEETV